MPADGGHSAAGGAVGEVDDLRGPLALLGGRAGGGAALLAALADLEDALAREWEGEEGGGGGGGCGGGGEAPTTASGPVNIQALPPAARRTVAARPGPPAPISA